MITYFSGNLQTVNDVEPSKMGNYNYCFTDFLIKVSFTAFKHNCFSSLQYPVTKRWYHYVTVEPTMFFYMMAFMITNVVEQTFYIFKACTVNHGYSPEICYNITSNATINTEVQVILPL